MTMERVFIKDYPLGELESWVEQIGERRFRARQVYRHIYGRLVGSWDECTDLGKLFRAQLEYGTHLHALELREKVRAEDGTTKYLFACRDGALIESVLIPDPPRHTLCVSSQVGCALGCRFCLTGTLGLARNLRTAEIVDQLCQVQRDAGSRFRISNIVFMGMGEPLANFDAVMKALRIFLDPGGLAYSHRKITLSTCGLIPQIKRLGRESPVNLALSLHAPNDAVRSELMPINRKYSLDPLLEACRDYPIPTRKRITFEYILLKGVNDAAIHARELARRLQGIRSKVNLIAFNPHPNLPFESPSEERIRQFQEILRKAGYTATIRESRGSDIHAACGQLAARAAGFS